MDITTLPFPFNYMHQIMKPGQITSILSALANNAIADIFCRVPIYAVDG